MTQKNHLKMCPTSTHMLGSRVRTIQCYGRAERSYRCRQHLSIFAAHVHLIRVVAVHIAIVYAYSSLLPLNATANGVPLMSVYLFSGGEKNPDRFACGRFD